MTPTEVAVRTSGLTKKYGDKLALDGVDLAVPRGTVHGLLGPNGAGKTTTVRILATLTRSDAGEASVAGYDVRTHPRQVRSSIGLVGQQTAVDDKLNARQNLTTFGRLFRLDRSSARRRADELLEQFSLQESASRSPKTFSGGMRRRLDLAASMILAPAVLFLDEPTTGLDPAGRREVWQAVRDLAEQGTTVLMTTHYLDEADQLCDRISVIDHGRNFVEDTPTGLKRRIGDERLEVAVSDPDDLARVATLVERVAGAEVVVDQAAGRTSVAVPDGVSALTAVASEVRAAAIELADIGLRRPTLDEAFLHLTQTVPAQTASGQAASAQTTQTQAKEAVR
ncbi:ATP-binding cassette domain-containing protein [Ornithinimicrobium faecis]|uniref:ATP-binding cassette domain-containing protein n=1 Tax=Ornithinimicrobium faecis TaxID=2934158 RepID=A0ABY4YRG1_9MICO|nr:MULTISPECIES: ATP-binding cassette domain-containing protein [unclassified Ornithinimicrobium]USQ79363.1 ATP-binding cassette domain-containing protein [Ornithinimicrobium sp. HY1793]